MNGCNCNMQGVVFIHIAAPIISYPFRLTPKYNSERRKLHTGRPERRFHLLFLFLDVMRQARGIRKRVEIATQGLHGRVELVFTADEIKKHLFCARDFF